MSAQTAGWSQQVKEVASERFGALAHRTSNALSILERRPALGRRAVIGTWLVSRAVLFAGMLIGHSYCDPAFYKYAGLLASGQLPFHDVAVEYPPLAMLVILLPALPLLPFAAIAPRPDPAFVANPLSLPQPNPVRYGAYGISFAVMMLVFDALTLWLVMLAARRLLPRDPQGIRSAMLYVGLIFLSGALLQKFDLLAGSLSLLAVFALALRRNLLAGVTLGLATLVKGFPVLALPIFVVFVIASAGSGLGFAAVRAQIVSLRRLLGAFALVVGGVTLAVALWAGFGALWHTVTYHTGRGTEIESLYGNLLLLVAWLPGLHASTTFSGEDLSRVVISPLNGTMDILATLALLLGIVVVYVASWRAIRAVVSDSSSVRRLPEILSIATLAALLVFEVTFRALPAHYLLVVAPLGVLVRLPARREAVWWASALIGITVLSQVIIAIWHSLVILLEPWAVALLTIRNACWLLALIALVVSLWHWPSGAKPGRSEQSAY